MRILKVFLLGCILLFQGCSLIKPSELIVRDQEGRILLNVYECGASLADLAKWSVYEITEFVNEDGSGSRQTLLKDPNIDLAFGVKIDLINRDGTVEPIYSAWAGAMPDRVTAFRKNDKWYCFSGRASWLSVRGKSNNLLFSYYVMNDRRIKLNEWTGDRIEGFSLVWNWQPPQIMNEGKRRYSEVDQEIELVRWKIK